MGSPIKITEMAENLIYLMGREPHKDIEIRYTGLREGEKINESLYNEEVNRKTKYEEIMVAKPTIVDWNYFNNAIDELIEKAHTNSSKVTAESLKLLAHYGNSSNSTNDTTHEIQVTEKQTLAFT